MAKATAVRERELDTQYRGMVKRRNRDADHYCPYYPGKFATNRRWL